MSATFSPHIARMAGYVPGEQPQGGGFIKLNTNENPYPPSPRVKEALVDAVTDRLRLYPDPVATEFRRAAARLHGVEPDMILAGNGSDDLLTIITRAFVGPGDLAAYPTPSYLLYSTLIRLQDGREHVVPFTAGLDARPRPPSMQPGLKLVYLANPNSPSGRRSRRRQVAELAERLPCPLVVDEAYADFARRALHPAGERPPQRDRDPVVQQGLQPGRHPPGLPGRPGRGRRAAQQGQGFVQLRHPQPGGRGRRARGPGLPGEHPVEDPGDPRPAGRRPPRHGLYASPKARPTSSGRPAARPPPRPSHGSRTQQDPRPADELPRAIPRACGSASAPTPRSTGCSRCCASSGLSKSAPVSVQSSRRIAVGRRMLVRTGTACLE